MEKTNGVTPPRQRRRYAAMRVFTPDAPQLITDLRALAWWAGMAGNGRQCRHATINIC